MTETPHNSEASLRLGWEEWLSLPELGLPALKVKVDTGARTSALHATDIETFGPKDAPRVRFTVHPIPGREDLVIPCSAPVVDRREVTSSNGETELRYVIETALEIDGHVWPIEVTLTDRRGMASHMLLGRQALTDNVHCKKMSRANSMTRSGLHGRPLYLAVIYRDIISLRVVS